MSQSERDRLEAAIAERLDAADYEGAAKEMLEGYGLEVLGYLIAQTRDQDLADDVFATTCEDLWKGLPQFRREASARTWLYKIAYNALMRHHGEAYRKRRRPLPDYLSQLAASVRSQTARFLRTETKDAISALRAQLSAEEQTLLTLRVDRGLSWREVGEVMAGDGEPPTEATLAKRFQRIKDKLRRLAAESGLLPDE